MRDGARMPKCARPSMKLTSDTPVMTEWVFLLVNSIIERKSVVPTVESGPCNAIRLAVHQSEGLLMKIRQRI